MPVENATLLSTTDPMLSDPDGRTLSVSIDVDRLIETRLLVQANSGAGKSWALRRILEQTWGKVQHIVLDVEDEFHTMRETYDYVLAAPKGGDCVADVRSAALLARRLLELGASAIINIYELGVSQRRFVKLFIESMMSAPRDLWHPVMVVIDEAHKFCAEKEDAESSSAVIDLMTRGRKRGFCGVLATQRLSKLDKDAAAETNNLLIGRTALDLDVARAALVLGMSLKDARATLPKLAPGEFYCVGPALSTTVERIRIGHVKTSHPKAGTRGAMPTPPRDTVRRILAKLADLPAEAEEEQKTVDELRRKVRDLEAEARSRGPQEHNYRALDERAAALEKRVIETENERDEARSMQRVLEDMNEDLIKQIDAALDLISQMPGIDDMKRTVDAIGQLSTLAHALHDVRNKSLDKFTEEVEKHERQRETKPEAKPRPIIEVAKEMQGYKNRLIADGMPAMHRAMLTVLAQRGWRKHDHFVPIPKAKILIWSGYARGGATSKAFADLVKNGWAVAGADGAGALIITNAGLHALGSYEPLPTGRALRSKIVAELPDMERKIFDIACEHYPTPVGKQELLHRSGYARGGATSKAFAYLVAREYLVADGPGRLRAAKELFE